MILRQFLEDSLAQSAYLVGCPATGEALVVDPTIDIRPYIEAAAAEGLRITGAAETHIHADYVSGSRALALATGATAYISGEGGPDWQYAWANEPGVRCFATATFSTSGGLALRPYTHRATPRST